MRPTNLQKRAKSSISVNSMKYRTDVPFLSFNHNQVRIVRCTIYYGLFLKKGELTKLLKGLYMGCSVKCMVPSKRGLLKRSFYITKQIPLCFTFDQYPKTNQVLRPHSSYHLRELYLPKARDLSLLIPSQNSY